jgi:hypothetical protein
MKYFALCALSFAAFGMNIHAAQADCDTNYILCMSNCGGTNPILSSICAYNCSVERTECKKNPDNGSGFVPEQPINY